jgi:hypothetical protein
MKRLFLLLFVLLSVFSCKKETTPTDPTINPSQNEYYIKFKVDGLLEEYKSNLITPQGQFNIEGNNQTFVSAVAVFGVIDKMEAEKETLVSNGQNGGCFLGDSY